MINMPESKTETNAPGIRLRQKRKPMSKPSDMSTDAPPADDAAPTAPVAKAETAWDGYAKTDRECNAALYGLFLG